MDGDATPGLATSPQAPDGHSTGAPSNLRLRLATAAVGLPLLGAVVWLGGWPFALVAGVIALLASAEFVHGWLIPTMPIRMVLPQAPTFGAAAMMVAGVHAATNFLWVGLGFAVLFAAMGYPRTNAFGPRKPYRIYAWCLVYVGLLMSTFVLLRDSDQGRSWFLVALLGTFAVDTGAYAVGVLFGRHSMAPHISPKKTWEGAAGGMVAGVLSILALNALLDTGVGAWKLLPFAIIAPPVAMTGDLLESWMKRRMGVKDASGLLPGHGGFLDRLDSLLFVLPVFYLFLRLRVL
ncbi:MAG: phosphatidate cytidylyltransferase [Tepidiformaceae bacterium]